MIPYLPLVKKEKKKEIRVIKMVEADFFSFLHFWGYLTHNKMYKRILVSHLKASSLKLPLTLAGVPPCRLVSLPPRLIAGLWQELLKRWLLLAGGPRRPMRFCCRPPSCPGIALIFISHQKKKMQKGKGAVRKQQTRLKKEGRHREKGLRDRVTG